jgi:hypothetical protein
VPLNCAPRLVPWRSSRFSGASVHNASATRMVSTPRPPQTARQLANVSTQVNGEPTTTPPRPPTAITRPFTNGSRAGSKYCASALNAAPRQTDTPTPIKRRPSIIAPIPCAVPNTQIPAAANSSVPAVTRRVP